MDKLGKVFMLDDDIFFLNLYHDLLEKRGFDIFTTTNAYQFLMYAKEINPDIFVLDINMPEVSGWEVLHMLDSNLKNGAPVVMTTVSSDKQLAVAKGVAHYLYKPVEMESLLEIIEAYCLGDKKHDVLLIDDYNPFSAVIKETLGGYGLSAFEVNDLRAAELYMRKNKPRAVCINSSVYSNDEINGRVQHDNIFYVENRTHLEKLASFLK